MAQISREEARNIIAEIRQGNGWISPEARSRTLPEVLNALSSLSQQLGDATRTLATNLYSRDTRFIYELIQNAEDTEYSRAQANGLTPYVSFSIHPNQIIVDSNEDGFEVDHVKAICKIGGSTKSTVHGYIGEKGIGFKSVFKIAKKVHIQSGPFSFSFEYTRDSEDSGLGMVTPMDEDHLTLPANVQTRMRLTLLDSTNFDERLRELQDMPESLLLFLSKLRTIYVNVYSEHAHMSQTTYQYSESEDRRINSVKKTTTINSVSTEDIKRFQILQKEIRDLPSDPARRLTRDATVVLAFPINAAGTSVIESQQVFAYLPLRWAGFKFLIQSDFITQASREDVFHSPRNDALLDGVARTFKDAVLRFCEDPNLRYTWMRYLPDDAVSDQFWRRLIVKITLLLQQTPCLRSRSGSSLYIPSQLRWLTDISEDRHGDPLFEDLDRNIYLSASYQVSDLPLLTPLGTRAINYAALIERAKADLERTTSRYKSPTTDDDWHTRAAQLLSDALAKCPDQVQIIQSLNLIPLVDGRWVSARTPSIVFPQHGNTPVPRDLGLRILDPSAVSNTARKKLFIALGVRAAVSSEVITLIRRRYSAGQPPVGLEASVSHLRYLYWNDNADASATYGMQVLTNQVQNGFRDIYFREPDVEYGAYQLLCGHENHLGNAQACQVKFLDERYLQAVSPASQSHGRSWKVWLRDCIRIREFPPLVTRIGGYQLSPEMNHVIAYRPHKLVGLLKFHWRIYESQIIDHVAYQISNSLVPAGENQAARTKLKHTFLPLTSFRQFITNAHISWFPFLTLPHQDTIEREDEWRFLEKFGVQGSQPGVKFAFYMAVLERLAVDNPNECSLEVVEVLSRVYCEIQTNCVAHGQLTTLRDCFRNNARLYVPSTPRTTSAWVTSRECVWNAPPWFELKRQLQSVQIYTSRRHLIQTQLEIRDANSLDYIQELCALRSQNQRNDQKVHDIYNTLMGEFDGRGEQTELQGHFELRELIFSPSQNNWHPLSAAIWADTEIQIPGRVSLRSSYPSLENFFCRTLGVPTPDLAMHVHALEQYARGQQPQMSEIKSKIMLISSMNPTSDDVSSLMSANIFQVKFTSAETSLARQDLQFVIPDHREYRAAFSGRLTFLDFTIEEIYTCKPFLRAFGFGDRYLSTLVEERTQVQEGELNHNLSLDFRERALAVYRCAVHYDSPKTRHGNTSLMSSLSRISVYLSDFISKTLSATQNGETISVERSRATFHITENRGELHFYLPRGELGQDECFGFRLPKELLAFLGIADQSAREVIGNIFRFRSIEAVNNDLYLHNIIEVDGLGSLAPAYSQSHSTHGDTISDTRGLTPNPPTGPASNILRSLAMVPRIQARHEPLDVADQFANLQLVDQQPLDMSNTLAAGTSRQRRRDFSNPEDQMVNQELADSPPPNHRAVQINAVAQFQAQARRPELSNPIYRELLGRVIVSARRLRIPFNGRSVTDNTHNVMLNRIFIGRSWERDRRVGAAGELLVFELLSACHLPNFCRENWRSTIRREVCVHPAYHDMEPWTGPETADIVYEDVQGLLTDTLIFQGYLRGNVGRPTYYIEVKTTTRDLGEPFYISGAQYRRMQSMKLEPGVPPSEIYILCRVFNLEGRIGLRMYLDPETARLNRELEFSVDTWAVRQGGNIANG